MRHSRGPPILSLPTMENIKVEFSQVVEVLFYNTF